MPVDLRPLGELASRLDFTALLDQRGRLLKADTALPQLALIPEKMVCKEAVGQPFELVLDCVSPSAHFELKSVLGEQISMRLLQADGTYRPWHGYVCQAAQLGSDGGLARYRLVMRPWLHLLALRRDCYVYQDLDALQIIEDIFRDHPQAHYRIEVSETLRVRSLCTQLNESDLDFVARLLAEEGLSYYFEHLTGEAEQQAAEKSHAKHVLVITDRLARRPHLGDVRYTSQHPSAKLAGQRDAITAFRSGRQVQPNAVTLGSWDYKKLAGTAAQDHSSLDFGQLPTLELYDGSGAYRYQDAEHAQRAAALALAALELDFKQHEGQGSPRHFAAGATFTLIDHPLYGANTSALNYAGALTATHERPDNEFTLLAVELHCANNLGAQAAQLLQLTDVEHGSCKVHFHAAPAAAPVVPRHLRKPTVSGMHTALVVGVEGDPLTTERDQRIKIQFSWQRGERPLPGGLPHNSSADPRGNAPGNHQSGTWVRVAQPSAGANWGPVYTPRIGSQVGVEFIDGDIDRPIVLGQLHNSQDRPPFSAGEDSGVNHPGVISGVHTQRLDQAGYNQWAIDDATGQVRMRLLCSYTTAELGLGHLIQHSEHSAQRGAWRGSGFEAGTQGWATLRAARGMLLSTSARPGSYGSAQSTQMDASEAVSQLKGARDLGNRLSEVAQAGGALPLSTHANGQAVEKFIDSIDPAKDGKHPDTVNGQAAKKAEGRTLTDPVEAFAQPVIVLDTPSSAAWASEASIASYSGQDLSLTAQGDLQQTAAHTWASVSGQTTSVYTHEGGIHAIAANGPISLRAHTDELEILADQSVTVTSVNGEIHIQAQDCIELTGGDSRVVLKGPNIDFITPGSFEAEGSVHAFLGGGGQAATIAGLPVGLAGTLIHYIEVERRYFDGTPVQGAPVKVTLADGSVRAGKLGSDGRLRVEGVKSGPAKIEIGEDEREWKADAFEQTPNPAYGKNIAPARAAELYAAVFGGDRT